MVAAPYHLFDMTTITLKRATVYFTWADRSAVVAVALFTISPALVLFTINLADLGWIALGLWLVHIGVLLVSRRSARN